MKKFKDMLSTRAKNGLTRCFGKDALDTPETIAVRREKLYRAVGLGDKSLREIAFLLCKFGYIDNVDQWFDR